MPRLFTCRLAALLCLLSTWSLHCAAADFDGMVNVGQGQVHAVQAGEGAYTVVFEAGFGSDLAVWRKVAPEIAKRAQVLVYSRPGTGKSPARAQPLTLEQNGAELAALLAQRQIKPPYILVGHSFGGFVIRTFAAHHPAGVAGMVFVDPADEGLISLFSPLDPDGVRLRQDQKALAASAPPQLQGDLRMVQQILDAGQLPAMPALPDVPTVLLTSVRARAGSDYFQETPQMVKLKRARHGVFMSQFSTGAQVFTANSGHNIQLQEPELVIAAIDQVLTAAVKAEARRVKEAARQALMAELEQVAAALGQQPVVAGLAQRVAAALKHSRFDESEINTLGFDVMTKGRQPALAQLVLAYNAGAFAQSDNAADSYGEVLLAVGQPELAREQFARALALGQANGARAQTLAGYQQRLEQAALALKSAR